MMKPSAMATLRPLAWVLPLVYAISAHPDPSADALTCESRTVNYIIHTLPQQCLTTSPTASVSASVPVSQPISASDAAPSASSVTVAASVATEAQPQPSEPVHNDDDDTDGEDLSTGAFMSFDEWKAMMVAKSGPEVLDARPRRARPDVPGEGFDSLGDEGEISFDFDAYSDRISEMASPARPSEAGKEVGEQVEKVTYDEGFTYYRSKDAGTTCKERFSYSSFDAGATVKKTSPAAKNPTAILVENKDAYMLLECGRENKFFIVELSDVILVDTVVLANFEFFSSNTREFRVSISDRYPVSMSKWKVLGTFTARNSRDIQAFLIDNPQDWARYLRVEILSHYGNEYYCPISLLRVHGLRMLDSWKQVDPSELETEEDTVKAVVETTEEAAEGLEEEIIEAAMFEDIIVESSSVVTEQSPWTPYWHESYLRNQCSSESVCKEADAPKPNMSGYDLDTIATTPAQPHSTIDERTASTLLNTSSSAITAKQTTPASSETTSAVFSVSNSAEKPAGSAATTETPVLSITSPLVVSSDKSSTSADSTTHQINPSTAQNPSKSRSSVPTSVKPPSSRSSSAKSSSGSQTAPRNKTSTTTSALSPTPTMQDSFFKALTKRLQVLETNMTLSNQYIESQSKFLQEALAKLERRQVAKVDHFLGQLNQTVLGEMRELRMLYDQVWQSTVIALESQREQHEREFLALSSRVGVLADEVAFQKRMAIIQSVLLLGCLVLVIFSRGFASPAFESYYMPSRLASPIMSPRDKSPLNRTVSSGLRHPSEAASRESTPVRNQGPMNSAFMDLQSDDKGVLSPNSESLSGSKGAESDSTRRPLSPTRALSDPLGIDFQPPTPSSMEDMAYDSEPNLMADDYFSSSNQKPLPTLPEDSD
ncbi:UNC-like C-terminal-domain-containing protein [Xylariaceae sp. FL1019]|nr:UNC-like C-terminal-domain-containing protein [Xylariaceae sp. FL1019]